MLPSATLRPPDIEAGAATPAASPLLRVSLIHPDGPHHVRTATAPTADAPSLCGIRLQGSGKRRFHALFRFGSFVRSGRASQRVGRFGLVGGSGRLIPSRTRWVKLRCTQMATRRDKTQPLPTEVGRFPENDWKSLIFRLKSAERIPTEKLAEKKETETLISVADLPLDLEVHVPTMLVLPLNVGFDHLIRHVA